MYAPGVSIRDPVRLDAYLSRIHSAYPRPVHLTQRIIVQVRNRDFDMLGHLLLKSGSIYHAVALGDLGVELFQFRIGPDEAEIVTRPSSVPPGPLCEGVIEDLRHLYGDKRSLPAELVTRSDGCTGLVLRRDNGCLEEYQFPERFDAPVRSLGVRDGRIIREAEYRDFVDYPGLTHSVPGSILIRNHEWHYSMRITLLGVRISPGNPRPTNATKSQ